MKAVLWNVALAAIATTIGSLAATYLVNNVRVIRNTVGSL